MALDAIANRKRIRERMDATALHNTTTLSAGNPQQDIKLDIVARKITVQVPSTITVTITGSINGKDFFAIAAGVTNTTDTYGDQANEHLVKVVRILRTAGDGVVTVAGA